MLNTIVRLSGPVGRHYRLIATVVLFQYFAVVLGVIWGFAQVHFGRWIPDVHGPRFLNFNLPAGMSVAFFFVEALRYFTMRRLRRQFPCMGSLCLFLGFYTAWLMCTEPFYVFRNPVKYFRDIFLLMPLIIVLGPLVRVRSWLGCAASIIFCTISLGMIIANACSTGGRSGFFESDVF